MQQPAGPSPDSLSACLQAARAHQRDYSPVSWAHYFDEAHDIKLEPNKTQISIDNRQTDPSAMTNDSFRVYLRNFRSPMAPNRNFGQVLDSNQSECSQSELDKYCQYPTLVMLHGGGYSGLSWAQFTQCIEQHCDCRILAMDLRGHGDTKTNNDDQMDIETLIDDVIRVTHATHRICGFPETPKIIIIGHSMGGAIAVKCSMKCTELMPTLVGFVIIDVVEGTAKEALPLMMSVINTRPNKFPTLGNAIEWSVRSGMAKNVDAARVSMPGNLVNINTGHLSIHDIEVDLEPARYDIMKHKFHISLEHLLASNGAKNVMRSIPQGLPISPRIASLRSTCPDNPLLTSKPRSQILPSPTSTLPVQRGVISEETSDEISASDLSDHSDGNQSDKKISESETQQVDGEGYKKPPLIDSSGYCWRTDLAKTQPFWNDWFDGLSDQLLSAPVQGKFLLLAGIDRLDKTLTIGQMQGKFMMKVLPKCGHAVHEDVPEQVASAIGSFLVRNKFTPTQNE